MSLPGLVWTATNLRCWWNSWWNDDTANSTISQLWRHVLRQQHLIRSATKFNFTFLWPSCSAFKPACWLCHLWSGFPSMMRACSPHLWGNDVAGLLEETKRKKRQGIKMRHFICFFSELIMQKCHARCYRERVPPCCGVALVVLWAILFNCVFFCFFFLLCMVIITI